MKKSIYILSLITLGLFAVSCGNDDDSNNDNSNFIKFGDQQYDLTYGSAEDYGMEEDGVYNIDLTFQSDDSIDGKGIYFDIYSSTPNKLAPGVYNFNETSKNPLSFGFAYYFDYTVDSFRDKYIKSGTITVLESEKDYYELTFSCIDESNTEYNGRFYGSVTYSEE